jgi:uncharacterized membrane protein
MNKLYAKKFKLWQLCVPLLALANVAYLPKNFVGWIFTLCFFLFMPGYLLLNCLRHGIKNKWEVVSFSLGLSLLLLMISGLALNSMHALGLNRPLTTWNIFITLDIVTFVLLVLTKNRVYKLPKFKLHLTAEKVTVSAALTLLPLLAIGGAVRLNNGASNILTMILFAAIPILFVLLIWRKNLKPYYPYAILMFSIAILLSTSLRGWYITGHDIQHEFNVFQIASKNNFWSISNPSGDTYNACLSITILPTIIAKITSISAVYVYKVVFQIIFALGLVPIYYFIKRLGGAQRALVGAFIFISFPTFFNDMPFLNRQEIAFVFFALLLLTTFLNMARRPKTVLTMLFLVGIILSHYSSGYIALSLLLLSWLIFKLLTHRRLNYKRFVLPVLSLPIILVALLFTFLWNAQITTTTSGLEQTVTQTFKELWNHSSSQSSSVSYSLFSLPTQNPSIILSKYAGKNAAQVNYVPEQNMPITRLGRTISNVINVGSLNNKLRSFSSKILQVLLLLGLIMFFFRQRKRRSATEIYFYALNISCIILLVMITLLPRISVDYGITRLFQQTLIITSLLIVLAAEMLLGFFGRFKIYIVAIFFGLLFLDLSGFAPQALGEYPAQLALNNSGTYYDLYFVHKGELVSANWLVTHDNGLPIISDQYAGIRFSGNIPPKDRVIDPALSNNVSGYLYQDFANAHQGLYASFIDGDVLEYTYNAQIMSHDLLYVNQDSNIYSQ